MSVQNQNSSSKAVVGKDLTLDDFKALAQSACELSADISLDKLLKRILETASKLTDSPETSIILRNERRPTLYFAAATGEQAEWVLSNFGAYSEDQVPIEGSKAGLVYETGKSLVENVVHGHFEGVDEETKKVTKSMVCVPLRVGEQRLGVMQVLNKRKGKYGLRDQKILEHFSDQASIAIRNARLLESLLAHSGMYGPALSTDEIFQKMYELNQPAKTELLTVMFADMRGFTQLCQSLLHPVLVQEKLSSFISMLSESVISYDGMVNKFLGDGVMALFRGDDSSMNAVRCAFSIVHKFSEMKHRWDEESNQQLDFLDVGVGITTDQVILGGIGTDDLRDYTAIGTPVNLAAAFESIAREGKRVLCDQVTYRRASEIVLKAERIDDFKLIKPGQEVGVRYKCYNLEQLQEGKRTRVFVSHSHGDRKFAEQLIKHLKENEIDTWYSVVDIEKGSLWTAEIRKAILHCNWMVVVVSKNSAGSRWTRKEVDLAVTSNHLEDHIIPVVIDDTDLASVNAYLATMQAVYFQTCDDIPAELANRIKTANKNE